MLQTLQPDPKQNCTFHYHLKSLAQIQYLRFQLHQYYKKHSPSKFGKFEIGLVKTYLMPTRGTFYKIIDLIRKFTIIQHLKLVTRIQDNVSQKNRISYAVRKCDVGSTKLILGDSRKRHNLCSFLCNLVNSFFLPFLVL